MLEISAIDATGPRQMAVTPPLAQELVSKIDFSAAIATTGGNTYPVIEASGRRRQKFQGAKTKLSPFRGITRTSSDLELDGRYEGGAGAAVEETTPVQKAVAAVERRLEILLSDGRMLCGGKLPEIPQGTVVWEAKEGVRNNDVDIYASDIIKWVKRFKLNTPEEVEDVLGETLAKHVVLDEDAGLIGTR